MRGTRRNARPLENNLLTLWIRLLDRLVEEDHEGVITEVEAPPILRPAESLGSVDDVFFDNLPHDDAEEQPSKPIIRT